MTKLAHQATNPPISQSPNLRVSGFPNSPCPVRQLGRLLTGASPRPDMDWEAVVDLARQQHLAPFLFWQLRAYETSTAQGALPPGLLDALWPDFYAAVVRNREMRRHAGQVLAALAAAGVPTLVFKGLVVADLYPHWALRHYGDVDVLVPQAQWDRARRVVEGRDPQISVDLQTHLDGTGSAGRLPVDELWARAVPWSVAGQPTLRFEPVDAALQLCRHTAVQHWGSGYLHAVIDLALLTGDWGPDQWHTLVRRAEDWELGRAVALMFVLMNQVLGRPVPEAVAALYPAGSEPLPDDLAELLLPMQREPVNFVAGLVWPGLGKLRVIGYMWRRTFRRPEEMAYKYRLPPGSPWVWATYLRRPFDLLRRYAPALGRWLRREPAAQAAWSEMAWLQRWLRGEPSETPAHWE